VLILFPEYFIDYNLLLLEPFNSTSTSLSLSQIKQLRQQQTPPVPQQKEAAPQPQVPQAENAVKALVTEVKEVQKEGKLDPPAKSLTCPYMKLSDLSELERFPKATKSRHAFPPPADTKIDLVCCETTRGPWNIAVHHSWAPIGAARFVEMVQANHFSSPKVPFMRCISNFLCQFGLNGPASKRFEATIPDDRQWLPTGSDFRANALGMKRFQRGYFSYAGSGSNSRSNQIFVALADHGMLGGGSPWEVPWGELVGKHSFVTLNKIYKGYGDKGPSQRSLHLEDAIRRTEQEYPLISWVLGCQVVDQA
jgi:peptidyl-prolyl cis-trans isomerase A (cyclophilin A)